MESNEIMSKKSASITIDYNTEATPRAVTSDGVPVFCSYDQLEQLNKIIPNPLNPNHHGDEQIRLLAEIIKSTGWRGCITVSTRSGFIVKGHGRLKAAQYNHAQEAPVEYQEYASEAEEYADLIADNRLAELATMDDEKLAGMIKEMNLDEVPLELTGYTEADLAELLGALDAGELDPDNGVDNEIEEAEELITLPGDLWLLGPHRLICGDSTDDDTIARLMNGEKAQLINTDPPYGVSYESNGGDTKWKKIAGDDLTQDDLMTELLIPVFKQYVKNSRDDAAFYIWHASSTRRDFEDAMIAAGIMEKQYIIWVKNSIVLGRADYQWSHEPCFYAEKAGQSAKFCGDRTQRTTWKVVQRTTNDAAAILTGGIVVTDGNGAKLFIQEKPPKGKKARHIRLTSGKPCYLYDESKSTTVWEVSRESKTVHPTQKPVELATRAIMNSTEAGDLIVDFFGGSGSTLIGAQLTGRRANSCELEPQYCDAIVRRYLEVSGNTDVVCIRDGKEVPIAELAPDWLG